MGPGCCLSPRLGQGGTVPGGAAQPLRRGFKGRVPNGWLEAGGLRWASVAVISPGDLVVRVPSFDLLSGDRVLGSTVSHGVAVHVDLLVLALVGNAPASHALAAIPLLLHLARYLVVDVGWEEEGGSALSCGCP